ncbi:hormogonium tapered terminus morphoprotein TftA [Leptolyngbya ohadii]|uniref:hormogonium tapered terminus morphoprotein TftA n=1 Tax=Leptolyngbya ohadii TaxID=1962290 RepID=UPI000B59EF01|nr:N-acetylmuramoyl-L-alanine amidase [Leptolyngbya ohadii]
MPRIFVAAAYGEPEDQHSALPGEIDRVLAVQETILLRDRVVQFLRSRNYDAVAVPDELSLSQSIDWINRRSQQGDLALSLQVASATDTLKGAAVHHIAYNDERRLQASQLLQAYLRRVPQFSSRGIKPDTQTLLGRLSFCRDTIVPALHLEAGCLSHADDRQLLQNHRQEVALGIAEGLAVWSRSLSTAQAANAPIALLVNGAEYPEKGVLLDGNAYIPIDLIDQMGIDLPLSPTIHRISYGNVVYARAIDLRDYNLALMWDGKEQTLNVRSVLSSLPPSIDRIMGRGTASEVQMMMFLKSCNPDALTKFYDVPKLYIDEGRIEGVNHDIAFAQMCLETGYLQFSDSVKPEHHNFAGLGGASVDEIGAKFATPLVGVRAQIQHLKAYACAEPLVQAPADPRFHLVRRGIAPTVGDLSGRWSADPDYGTKILAIVKRLYEFADHL